MVKRNKEEFKNMLKDSGLGSLFYAFPWKVLFILVAGCWTCLFHLLGNATFGYIKSPSLFIWMYNAFTSNAQDDGHGLFLPFVVVGLLWLKRQQLIEVEKLPSWAGIYLIGIATFIHILGYVLQQPRFSIIAYFVGLYGIIMGIWGRRLAKAILFPYVLFLFMVPIGTLADSITVPLRWIATDISAFIARALLGIAVVKEGVQLIDPEGKFSYEVAAACSGIRSLVTILLISIIYAWIFIPTLWQRFMIILSAFPITVMSNVLRLTTIILIAKLYGQEAGLFVHEWFGFVTFAFTLVGLYLVEQLTKKVSKSWNSRL